MLSLPSTAFCTNATIAACSAPIPMHGATVPGEIRLQNQEGDKRDIFFKDTVRSDVEVTSANDVGEALAISLHEFGSLNIDHMGKLLGQHPDHVGQQLVSQGLAFLDPSDGWQAAAYYLSDNVRKKLVTARAAAAIDPRFEANVKALEKVQPEDLDHTEITVKMGAHWVPPSDVGDFASFLLNSSDRSESNFDIQYNPKSGEWHADSRARGPVICPKAVAPTSGKQTRCLSSNSSSHAQWHALRGYAHHA